jgi:general L-amino acid transport system permease protein
VTSFTGYAFAALFYFATCHLMSRYASGIERRLRAGERR